MTTKTILCVMAAVSLAVGCATNEAKLQSQAKVSKSEAEKIALAKVPNGTVKEAELEKEKGRLIWSFDIATPGSADITEVQVDPEKSWRWKKKPRGSKQKRKRTRAR